jgi:regulator of protease activity HflC (stomatin/prohibitin superfamily)
MIDPTATAGEPAPPPEGPQLTAPVVPIAQAREAMLQADANGRVPIIVIPDRRGRFRFEVVIAGAIALLVALLVPLSQLLSIIIFGAGVLAIIGGIASAFLVPVPDGAVALVTRSGRYDHSIGPGIHLLRPGLTVTHFVTTREIPFDAPVSELITADGVRVDVDALVTFEITDPAKFVYRIAATDFDLVLLAGCQEAMRAAVRGMASTAVLDVTGAEAEGVGDALSAGMTDYGVVIRRLLVTTVRLPAAFGSTTEGAQLAVAQRGEQQQQQALASQRQADADALATQVLQARVAREREQYELEAAANEIRLKRTEDLARRYPVAMSYDIQRARLEVARALAGNTRAIVQVVPGQDVANSLLTSALFEAPGEQVPELAPAAEAGDGATEVAPPPAPRSRSGRRARSTAEPEG